MKHLLIKTLTTGIFMLGFFNVAQPGAHALIFSDTVNFTGGKTITETLFNFNSDFSWAHDINDNLGGENINNVSISDASLTLNFRRTNGSTVNLIFASVFNPESWFLQDLGALSPVGNTAANQVFSFGANPLTDLQLDGIFTVIPQEFTLNAVDLLQRDNFQVFSSTLSGNYTINPSTPHSPEPLTTVMMLTGLSAAVILRRFKAPVE